MKNDKGYTLVEVLAALTISTIIISVCVAALMSLTQSSSNTTQHYTDKVMERRALDMLTRYITDTSQGSVNVFYNTTELRLNTTHHGLVAFRYESGGSGASLNLYTINNLASPTYTFSHTIADNLSATTEPIFSNSGTQNGQIKVKLPVSYTHYGVAKQQSTTTTMIETVISLAKY